MNQRIGVIGLGPIGMRHASIYSNMGQAKLVAICDKDKSRADAAARALNIKAYYYVQEILDTESLTIVSVATGGVEYGSDHYEPTIQVLNAGLHVLGEKPICNDINQAQEMVNLAREKGLAQVNNPSGPGSGH